MEKNYPAYLVALVAIIVFGIIVATSFMSRGVFNHHYHYNNYNNSNLNSSQLVITALGVASYNTSQVQLYVTANGTGNTTKAAVQNLSLTLNEFNSTIYNYVNGNLSRITTTGFNVYHIYNKSSFEAIEYLSILLPQLSSTSSVISSLSNITNIYITGANPILSPNQTTQLRSEALSNALANATSQAHALIGNKTIYSTNITIDDYYIYPLNYGAGQSSYDNGYTTTVNPQFYGGTQQVVERITVTFYYGNA